MTGRAADTARFYDLLDHLEARVGVARRRRDDRRTDEDLVRPDGRRSEGWKGETISETRDVLNLLTEELEEPWRKALID